MGEWWACSDRRPGAARRQQRRQQGLAASGGRRFRAHKLSTLDECRGMLGTITSGWAEGQRHPRIAEHLLQATLTTCRGAGCTASPVAITANSAAIQPRRGAALSSRHASWRLLRWKPCRCSLHSGRCNPRLPRIQQHDGRRSGGRRTPGGGRVRRTAAAGPPRWRPARRCAGGVLCWGGAHPGTQGGAPATVREHRRPEGGGGRGQEPARSEQPAAAKPALRAAAL